MYTLAKNGLENPTLNTSNWEGIHVTKIPGFVLVL